MYVLLFFIGLFIGGSLGFLFGAVCRVSGSDRRTETNAPQKTGDDYERH
jgi:hypothetical protein